MIKKSSGIKKKGGTYAYSALDGKLFSDQERGNRTVKQYLVSLFNSLLNNFQNIFAFDKKDSSLTGNKKYNMVYNKFYLDNSENPIYKYSNVYNLSAGFCSSSNRMSKIYSLSIDQVVDERRFFLSLEKTEKDLRQMLKSFVKLYEQKYTPYLCFRSQNTDVILKGMLVNRNFQYIFVHQQYTTYINLCMIKDKTVELHIYYIPHKPNTKLDFLYGYSNINHENWTKCYIRTSLIKETLLQESHNPRSRLSLLDKDIIDSKIIPSIQRKDLKIQNIFDIINHYIYNNQRSPLPTFRTSIGGNNGFNKIKLRKNKKRIIKY